MSIEKKIRPCASEAQDAGGMGAYTPRKLSLAENVRLTIKVLAGFALLGSALWGLNLWTAAK